MSDEKAPVTEELLVLYELAMSLGHNLDLIDNCRSFLDVLQRRNNIAYGSVWLFAHGSNAPGTATLAFGQPSATNGPSELPADHPMFVAVRDKPFVSIESSNQGWASVVSERGLESGACALFRLSDVGILKLFRHRAGPFSARELSQLCPVVERLAVAIEASLARAALQAEYSERLRAEEALRSSEVRFRDFADTAADWFWETDSALRITYVSEKHDRATGIEANRVLGKTPEARWLEDGSLEGNRQAFVDDLKAQRTFVRRDLRWEAVDGVQRVHSFSAKPYYSLDGDFLGYRGSARDVTAAALAEAEQERLEAQLKQAQKMEAIGQLTGGIAHDFNNILATVLGFTELARDVVPLTDERLDRYLEEIQLAGERARNLVAQMLTFSRGGTGEVGAVAVAPLVQEAVGLLRSTLPSSVQVTVSVFAPDATINSEAVSLQQVLMNLCINARDAMEDQTGQIGVLLDEESGTSGHCDSCHAEIRGARAVLTVHDTGGGIDPSIQQRIFDPFFSTKPPGKGTGMGLSMVHGIVHRHGGHIQVESGTGTGTTIRIHWPALAGLPPHVAPALPRVHLVPGRGERILVVDDERAVGGFLAEILQRRGYHVELTARAEEALEWASAAPCRFDLLVTDQTMPMLTGLELIRRVRAVHPDLPIILCSGYGESVAQDLEFGASIEFLRKPVSAAELVSTMQSLLAASAQDIAATRHRR